MKRADEPLDRSFSLASAVLLVVMTSLGTGQAAIPISPKAETAPVPTDGDAADDMAIWIHPKHAEQSLLIGTDKKKGLAVYDLDGKQRQFLPSGRLNNVDIRYRFPLGGKEVALLTSGERDHNVLKAFTVDPDSRQVRDVSVGTELGASEVLGCCMYRSPKSGETYFFVTTKDGAVSQWRLFDDGSGKVGAEQVRSFAMGGESEGCVADDENGWLFVGEEEKGIWRYGAEPGDGDERILVDGTGRDGHLTADVEGLAIYYARDGKGYLVASSQGNNTFVVYERAAPHEHRLSFTTVAHDEQPALDEVSDTDGIDLTNLALGNHFPGGLFAAQDGANTDGNQNFKLFDWKEIAAKANPPLTVDPEYDAYDAVSGP